jgi:hypothetical protein
MLRISSRGGSTDLLGEGEGGEPTTPGKGAALFSGTRATTARIFGGRRWSFWRTCRAKRWSHFQAWPAGLRFSTLASEHKSDFHYSTDVGDLGFKVRMRAPEYAAGGESTRPWGNPHDPVLTIREGSGSRTPVAPERPFLCTVADRLSIGPVWAGPSCSTDRSRLRGSVGPTFSGSVAAQRALHHCPKHTCSIIL